VNGLGFVLALALFALLVFGWQRGWFDWRWFE
jgi:hypothetical protein